MKKTIILVLLILSFSALAQDIDLAYSWLLQQPDTDTFATSLKTLAVSRADSSVTSSLLTQLRNSKHPTQACWPNPTCNVKDTALALIVESKIGINAASAEDISNWLTSRQSLAPLSGTWNLQIITPDSGTCGLVYQKQNEPQSQEFNLNIDKGKISYGSCQDQYFFNLNSCLGANILNKPSTIVEVSCQSLTSSKISIVYQENNAIYLQDSPISSRARLTINNGFFNNKQDTLYANWALKEASSNTNSLIYLKKNQDNSVIDQSLLYLITKDESFLNNLILLQSNFGQFTDSQASNDFSNGLAGLALQENGQRSTELELLKSWLATRQKQDGSWSSDPKTTSMVLYGAFQGGSITGTPNPILNTNCILSNPKWLNQNGIQISSASGSETGRQEGDTVLLSVQGTTGCGNDLVTFSVYEDELGQDQIQDTVGPVNFDPQEGFVFAPYQPSWFDDNPLPDAEGDPEYYFIAEILGLRSQNSSLLQVTKPQLTECSDTLDNDNNNLIDLEDPGCFTLSDLVEDANALACADGIDNDNDGLIDGNDPGCQEPLEQDNNEREGECTPSWSCDPWSICSSDKTQTRLCRDLSGCGEECLEGDNSCQLERSCLEGDDFDLPNDGDDDKTGGGDGGSGISPNPCSVNDLCEPEWGEDEFNCPDDCKSSTSDDTTDLGGVDFGDDAGFDDFESEPEETQGSMLWIIIIIILLLLVLAGAYFFVFKKPSKHPKGSRDFKLPSSSSRPPLFGGSNQETKRREPPKKQKKDRIDQELERSLREAKRLLEK